MRLPAACLILACLAAAPAGAVTLGILAPDLGDEPQARAAHAAQAAAQEKGWRAELRDAGGDAGAAAGALRELAASKVDGLLLLMAPQAELAAARGLSLPVVTVLSGASPAASFDVTINNYALGADIGAYLMGLMGYRGELALVRADADPGARARARVLEVMLEDAPGIHVTASLDEPPDAAGLEGGLARLAGQAGLNAVWAASDELGLAAEGALAKAGLGRGKVTLVSVGGSQETFARIRDTQSPLAATVAIPYELLGEAAVDLLDDLLAGTPREEIAIGPYLFIDPVLVDRSNVPAAEEWPW